MHIQIKKSSEIIINIFKKILPYRKGVEQKGNILCACRYILWIKNTYMYTYVKYIL